MKGTVVCQGQRREVRGTKPKSLAGKGSLSFRVPKVGSPHDGEDDDDDDDDDDGEDDDDDYDDCISVGPMCSLVHYQ